MPENIRACLHTIQGVNRDVEDYLAVQTSAAEHAQTVLREKGEFVVVTDGYRGGVQGLIGSAKKAVRLTQATRPVHLGEGDYVALRHNPSEKRFNSVELLALTNDDTEQLAAPSSDLEVLHEFSDVQSAMSIRTAIKLGNIIMNRKFYNSIDALVSTIDTSLEPLEGRSILPRVEPPGGPKIFNGVHHINNFTRAIINR